MSLLEAPSPARHTSGASLKALKGWATRRKKQAQASGASESDELALDLAPPRPAAKRTKDSTTNNVSPPGLPLKPLKLKLNSLPLQQKSPPLKRKFPEHTQQDTKSKVARLSQDEEDEEYDPNEDGPPKKRATPLRHGPPIKQKLPIRQGTTPLKVQSRKPKPVFVAKPKTSSPSSDQSSKRMTRAQADGGEIYLSNLSNYFTGGDLAFQRMMRNQDCDELSQDESLTVYEPTTFRLPADIQAMLDEPSEVELDAIQLAHKQPIRSGRAFGTKYLDGREEVYRFQAPGNPADEDEYPIDKDLHPVKPYNPALKKEDGPDEGYREPNFYLQEYQKRRDEEFLGLRQEAPRMEAELADMRQLLDRLESDSLWPTALGIRTVTAEMRARHSDHRRRALRDLRSHVKGRESILDARYEIVAKEIQETRERKRKAKQLANGVCEEPRTKKPTANKKLSRHAAVKDEKHADTDSDSSMVVLKIGAKRLRASMQQLQSS